MYSQAVLLSVLVALSEARFGQEQIPIAAIRDVTSGGQPGQAATLAGSAISTLLAAANPCAKLQQADLIVAQLGNGADSIAAARGLVAAEQNFNPFVVKVPSICSDPTLPKTLALRGVVPLVDPAVTGSDKENALSASSLKTPFNADGLSVAQVMAAQGFSNFTTKAVDGTVGAAPAGNGGAAAAPPAAAPPAAAPPAASAPPAAAASESASAGGGCTSTTFVTVTRAAKGSEATAAASNSQSNSNAGSSSSSSSSGSSRAASSDPKTGTFPGFVKSSIAGLDFGQCVPTIKFEAGLDGRKATENTFQAIDPVVNKGQEEALNPNIITNRICDQLTNVCGANAAAKTACTAAKAKIAALGTKDVTTANAWNDALGFAGTDTNPDKAPQAGLIGHD